MKGGAIMGLYDIEDLRKMRDEADDELYSARQELERIDGYRAYDEEEKEDMKACLRDDIERLEAKIEGLDEEIQLAEDAEEDERWRCDLCYSQGISRYC